MEDAAGLSERTGIDIAVEGPGLDVRDIRRWKDALEEALFPWTVDLIRVEHGTDPEIVSHINRVGIVLYEAGPDDG